MDGATLPGPTSLFTSELCGYQLVSELLQDMRAATSCGPLIKYKPII